MFKKSEIKHADGNDLAKIVKKFHRVTKDDLKDSFVVKVNDQYLALFGYAGMGRSHEQDFVQNVDLRKPMAVINVFCTADGRILKNNLPVKGDALYVKEIALPTANITMEVM